MLSATAFVFLLGQSSKNIDTYVPTNFKGASFTTKKVSANQAELAKINKDFGMSYRFDSMAVKIKEPHKLRLEGKVGDSTFLFIMNGTKKIVRAARANISITDDVAKEPGKRQTVFDFGLLTPALLDDYFDAKFVREDRTSKDMVFDLFYKKFTSDETRHRVWIDPKLKVITKREWYSQNGEKRLLATFNYGGFVTQGGVSFPTEYKVLNAAGKVAGSLKYSNLDLNPTLADSLFTK
jgi:hypothetical protein